MAKVFIKNGVSNGANKVATAVRVSDKAKFDLEIKDITFEASPLGEQPTKIIPACISGGKFVKEANVYPTIGIIVNWQITPINTPFGIFMMPTKSLNCMEQPIPNMMIINNGTMSPLRSKPPISEKIPG